MSAASVQAGCLISLSLHPPTVNLEDLLIEGFLQCAGLIEVRLSEDVRVLDIQVQFKGS